LTIKATLKSNSESTRTLGRGGEDREMVTRQSTKGSFEVTVDCVDKGKPKADEKEKDKDEGDKDEAQEKKK
jgi:hypothetical protein